jgi:predicted MFS family arabinose efflux permease
VREPAPHRWLAIPALVAMFLLTIGQGALWPFTERVGIEAGLSRSATGVWLGASTLAGLSGAAAASWLDTRLGRPIPLAVGTVLTVATAWGVLFASTAFLYVVMLLVWSIAYFFVIPYLLGTTAALDPEGRWTAAANGASAVASALGPASAGLLVTGGGYGALGWVIVAGGVAALALILPVASALERMPAAPRP